MVQELHGPPFQRPFTTPHQNFSCPSSCTDLHFRGLSQHEPRNSETHKVARTSISEAFHNSRRSSFRKGRRCTDLHFRGLSQQASRLLGDILELHGPPFQRPFTTKWGVPTTKKAVARTSISEAFHNKPIETTADNLLHGPPFQRPFTTIKERSRSQGGLHGPPFQRPFTTNLIRVLRDKELHGPPFQRPFTTMAIEVLKAKRLHGPPFQRPFTTKTKFVRFDACCTDLHFRGLSQLIGNYLSLVICCTDLHFRGLSQQ